MHTITQGKRVADGTSWHLLKPGEYSKILIEDHGVTSVSWYTCTPNGLHGWLKNHRVIENEDGTITVPRPDNDHPQANSILTKECHDPVDQNKVTKFWHGFIINGVWEEC